MGILGLLGFLALCFIVAGVKGLLFAAACVVVVAIIGSGK